MGIDIVEVLEHIPKSSIRKKTLRGKQQYLGIKLIVGPGMEYADGYLYVGKSSQLTSDALKKRIGLIVQNDSGLVLTREPIECIELEDDVNVLGLYEELVACWCSNEISTSVKVLTTMFGSKTIDSIIDSASKLLDNPIFILNERNELLAYSCSNQLDEFNYVYMLEHGKLSPEHLITAHSNSAYPLIRRSKTPILIDSFTQPNRKNIIGIVRRADVEEGTVIVSEYNRKLTLSDVDIVGSVCALLSHLISAPQYYKTDLAGFVYEQYFNALLAQKDFSGSWVVNWISYLHWNENGNFYLFAIQSPSGIFDNAETAKLRSQLHGVISSYTFLFLRDQTLVMLINVHNSLTFNKCVSQLEAILQEYELKAGVSNRFDNIQLITECYEQALDAIRISELLGEKITVSNFGEGGAMVFDLLLKSSTSSRRYEDYRLRVLMEYDRRFGTDYYQTLHVYLRNAHDKAKTAEKLFIHRNTLSARLLKIEEILECDLKDGEECMRLYLGFKSRELSHAQRLLDCQNKCDLALQMSVKHA
jgi:hypothetical protein